MICQDVQEWAMNNAQKVLFLYAYLGPAFTISFAASNFYFVLPIQTILVIVMISALFNLLSMTAMLSFKGFLQERYALFWPFIFCSVLTSIVTGVFGLAFMIVAFIKYDGTEAMYAFAFGLFAFVFHLSVVSFSSIMARLYEELVDRQKDKSGCV